MIEWRRVGGGFEARLGVGESKVSRMASDGTAAL
jgi:hypothetical protein